MNLIGKKNILFGLCFFVATVGLGLFLAKVGENSEIPDQTLKMLKQAHVHGNLESLLNIIFGFLIVSYGAQSETLSKVASISLILGTLCHSGVFYLYGLGIESAMSIASVGALLVLISIVLMIPIIYKGVR
jgi:uncharacterized membrane protein YgdD (TMEM256/DUF423 family)